MHCSIDVQELNLFSSTSFSAMVSDPYSEGEAPSPQPNGLRDAK